MVDHLARQQLVDIRKGLFLIRYATADDRVDPPSVEISIASGSERNLTLILHPEAREASLWQPGSCIVVRATAPGQAIVTVTPTRPRGSSTASIQIESLTQGAPPVHLKSSNRQMANEISFGDEDVSLDNGFGSGARRQSRGGGSGDINILGHVAGRGDVTAASNEWIGGPSAPSRIEGIAIEWPDRPPGVELRYAVRYGKRNMMTAESKGLGSFVGSRGKALPIVGVSLELIGGSIDNQLVAEALFLGAPIQRVAGQRIQLAGPTRQEPLVGLRLTMSARNTAAARVQPEPLPPATSARPGGRVRVFRGKSGASAQG